MAYGEIGSRIDYEQFDTNYGHDISTIKLSDGYVALFYKEGIAAAPTGYLKTYPISAAGAIGSLVDSWQLGSANCHFSYDFGSVCVQRITDDIYIFAYIWWRPTSPYDNYLILRTLTISDTGTITKSWIDSVNCGNGTARPITGFTRKPGTNVFAVTCVNSTTTGILYTFTVDDDGDNLVLADSWVFVSSQDYEGIRAQFTGGDILALTYEKGTTTYLMTCEVADDGTITKSVADQVAISSRTKAYMELVDTGVVALFFDSGYAATYSIDSSGNITALDAAQYKSGVTFNEARATNIGEDGSTWYFVITYRRGSYDGYLISLTIDPDGTINSIISEVYMQNINICMHTYPVAFGNVDILANTWNINDSAGMLDTYGVTTPAPGGGPRSFAYIHV